MDATTEHASGRRRGFLAARSDGEAGVRHADPGSNRRTVALAAGGDQATIDLDAGGRVASLVAGGAERLVAAPPPSADAAAQRTGWGCFLMAPWVGRLTRATLPDGTRVPATHGHHALHGTAIDAAWILVDDDAAAMQDREASHLRLACDLGDGGWPHGGAVTLDAHLSEGQLELTADVRAGKAPMPAALGWHPWFARPADGDLALELRAERVLTTDAELLPDGGTAPATGDLDLRGGPLLGERHVDHCYIDVAEPVVVRWPDLDLELSMGCQTYVVYTPAGAACVEPQSAWPDAPTLDANGHTETGLAHLGPGDTLTRTFTLRWHRR